MPFVKSDYGILEDENFYTTSKIINFLGDNTEYRIIADNFILVNGIVERNMPYKEFVIELEYDYIPADKDSIFFYIKDSNKQRRGLIKKLDEVETEIYSYWKMIYYKEFLQIYKSVNGIEWTNIGGSKLINPIKSQGFEIKGNADFKLKSYKVYKSPYITIYNCPRTYKVKLVDTDNNIIKEDIFDNLNQCKIYLDYCFNGKIEIFDTSDTLIYTTQLIELNYGDEYNFSPYDIELYYEDIKLDYKTVNIKDLFTKLLIKNVSNEVYTNLNIQISKGENSKDDIGISTDKINFYSNIAIDKLEPNEIKELYIKIDKNNETDNKGYKDFNITIY